MTDEEKLEKIKRTREQIENFCNYNCSVSKGDVVCLNCVRILDFQTGLAEGRKQSGIDIDVLTRENEQLKKESESDQLALNESKEIIAELKAQIEKMKCCANCKELMYCNKRSCDDFCNVCDSWGVSDD